MALACLCEPSRCAVGVCNQLGVRVDEHLRKQNRTKTGT